MREAPPPNIETPSLAASPPVVLDVERERVVVELRTLHGSMVHALPPAPAGGPGPPPLASRPPSGLAGDTPVEPQAPDVH